MHYTCTHTVEDIITNNNGTRIKVIATYGINDDRISVTGEGLVLAARAWIGSQQHRNQR